MRRALWIVAGVLALLVLGGYAMQKSYPKPQIASATGKAASDFTLQNSEGQPFALSQQRGKNVVLLFYRGYW